MGTRVETAPETELDRPVDAPGVEQNGLPSDDLELDVEAILSRSRPLNFRRKALYSAPEFVKRLQPLLDVKTGSEVCLECAYKGFPKPSVRWTKDDEEVTDGERAQLEEDGASLVLRIPAVQKWDEGTYRCRLENQEGTTCSTCFLEVKGDDRQKLLSLQPKKAGSSKRSVSLPPHLRAIREQKSMEEREAEALDALTPSPIHQYVDEMRRFHRRSRSYPHKDENQNEQPDSASDTDVSPLASSSEDHGGLQDATPNSDSVFFEEDQPDLNSSTEETPAEPPGIDVPAAIQLPLARDIPEEAPPHIPETVASTDWLYYCLPIGGAALTACATDMDIGWFIIFLSLSAVLTFVLQDVIRLFRGR